MSTYTENKDNRYETKDSVQGKNHMLLEIQVPYTTPCTLLHKTAYSSTFQSLLLIIQE